MEVGKQMRYLPRCLIGTHTKCSLCKQSRNNDEINKIKRTDLKKTEANGAVWK